MRIKTSILLLSMCLSVAFASAQTFQVSQNKRFIEKQGKPFFWLGDTAWELFHTLNREDADYYLNKRASQGYTVIQAVVLAELDGLNTPNSYGDMPLLNNDPTKPNEAYFKHVDYIVDKANENGLTIAMLPTWGDKVFKDKWGKGPEIFNVDNAKTYGKWLANRYKNRTNIIWLLGGDRILRQGSTDVDVWRAMAQGIEEGVGGKNNALISLHTQPNELGSSQWFQHDEWLDFNMFQTGHCRDSPIYNKIKRSYELTPIKPVIDGEPIYEDHPVCFNAKDLGLSSAYDVRKSAYLDLFAGAFGHTYGCHDIWQMYTPSKESVNGARIPWKEAVELPGAKQMTHVRKLIESHPMLDRMPDQSLIIENNLEAAERVQATRGLDYAFIYSAKGKPFHVNLGKISGKTLNAYWYDPRNGKTEEIGKVENTGNQLFTPPKQGYGLDYILILDDESKKYPKL